MSDFLNRSEARTDAQGLFALARRILAGEAEPAPAPIDPIDIRSGIDRALRQSRRQPSAGQVQAHAAARAISIVEGTLVAIDTIHADLAEAQELTSHALASTDPAMRALLAERYMDLINRIDTVAAGATFDGTNLINAGKDSIEIMIPAAGQPRHAVGHIRLQASAGGLDLTPPRDAFQNDEEIERAASELTRARARLIKSVDTFLNQASMLAPVLEACAMVAA